MGFTWGGFLRRQSHRVVARVFAPFWQDVADLDISILMSGVLFIESLDTCYILVCMCCWYR